MAMTDDETMEPTLGDIYVLGDDENKAEIEDMLEKIVEHQCEYGLKDDLRQVLTGCGYTVHRQDRGPEVLIDNYRPGKTFGLWTLRWHPDGATLKVDCHMPITWDDDGNWDVCVPETGWSIPRETVVDYGLRSILQSSFHLPAGAVREAADLLTSPLLAPDAQV